MQNLTLTKPEPCEFGCPIPFGTCDICGTAEEGVYRSPQDLERLRVYSIIQFKQRQAERKLAAAKRALSIANKLKNPAAKKYHRSRIFSALNKLRAMV
jgi:hypothetical protein